MQKLLMLHGALDTKKQFENLCGLLKDDFEVHMINFSGHGGKPMPAERFSIKFFAVEVIRMLDINNIDNINIAGHSMGGYIGLYLARFYSKRVKKVFTINTKLLWNEEIAAKEVKMLDAEIIEQKVPKFAERLRKLHTPNDWKVLMGKISAMLIGMGKGDKLFDEDFEKIENGVLLGVGDKDKMVSLEETLDVYKKLKNGNMLVMPDTQHPFENISTDRIVYEIKSFLGS